MRNSIAALAVACLTAMPLFCQSGPDTEPSTARDRELKACGPKENEVKYVADTDKNQHPTGQQAADKALVYILRPTMMGNKVQTKLAVDGEWKGVNRGNNYFFFTLPPGLHYFCSQAENRSVLVLTVEAGKTYYLEQSIHMGVMKARNDLGVIGDSDGQKALDKAHPSTWEVR
ncbi:MAG: DUF2846 domain-containing protein [Bryobacteraceae bacterium]|jgi:hypothetical protein